MTDAERYQKTLKRRWLAGLDPVEQVLRGLVRKAVERPQLVLRQVIEVGRVLDELLVDQLLQRGVAQALDVERANEVSQVLEPLGLTGRIDASGGGLTGLPSQFDTVHRSLLGHEPVR